LINLFVNAFKDMTFREIEPEKGDTMKLLDTRPFVWSKLVYPANRCIFNYVTSDNDFEIDFTKFLDRAEDVKSFASLHKIGFFIEYRDSKGNFHQGYYPDFIVKTRDEKSFIIETKGRVDVEAKDNRAKVWCEDATRLTGNEWLFARID
jgi:type III restriction enzyme